MVESATRPQALLGSAWQQECAKYPLDWQQSGRSLEKNEIETLKNLGCECPDWSLLRCAEAFQPHGYQHVQFLGACFLNAQHGQLEIEGVPMACGLSKVVLHNVWVGPRVVVRDCFLLSNLYISEACVLVDNGRICGTSQGWAQAWTMNFGNELGGRPCEAFPELSLAMADYRCQKGISDATWASEVQTLLHFGPGGPHF